MDVRCWFSFRPCNDHSPRKSIFVVGKFNAVENCDDNPENVVENCDKTVREKTLENLPKNAHSVWRRCKRGRTFRNLCAMLGGKGKTATKNRFALLIPMWMGVLANACGTMTYWGAYAFGGQTTRDSTESELVWQ